MGQVASPFSGTKMCRDDVRDVCFVCSTTLQLLSMDFVDWNLMVHLRHHFVFCHYKYSFLAIFLFVVVLTLCFSFVSLLVHSFRSLHLYCRFLLVFRFTIFCLCFSTFTFCSSFSSFEGVELQEGMSVFLSVSS